MSHSEWYTPAEYVEAVRAAMGGIDVDPASSEIAQRTVNAAAFFTMENDGLSRPWTGRVFLCPPYRPVMYSAFIAKLLMELATGTATEAVLLVNNSTDTDWFQSAAKLSTAICFTKGRIRWLNPEGERANVTQGQSFMYFGPNVESFKAAFSQLGSCGRVLTADRSLARNCARTNAPSL